MNANRQSFVTPPELIDDALGAIERLELTSLQWGHVDGSLSYDDLEDLIANVCAQHSTRHSDSDAVIEALIDRKLIFEFPQPDHTRRYRSRFSESVRLLTRLKQVFPKLPWPVAPDLVNDFRVDARPRLFPRRHVDAPQVLAHLEQHLSDPLTALQKELLRSLLVSTGPDGAGPQGLRLAQFQLDAATYVMEPARRDWALIVSAGTGTGKTIAFYLPAFLQIASWFTPGRPWVKALAVYPRVELLKDQFTEAFRLARRMDATLGAHQRPPILLGTYFSNTPNDSSTRSLEWAKWQRIPSGFICPYLRCPEAGCDGSMIWRTADLQAGRERLSCEHYGTVGARGCSGSASEKQLTLTRRTAQQQPPDIVFTTTEMLHQRLSDSTVRPVLGISDDPATRARLMLLDEVHTYAGISGGHAALVIRRWRHALAPQPVHFVGLSATLENACDFMSQLTGVALRQTREAKPLPGDMEPHGMHYQLVLRGDPASRAALLSTSIQTSFLLARLLDPPHTAGTRNYSDGRFGTRLFVFTDDLDVTNRLFDDLASAEAYDIFHQPQLEREPLAALRASTLPLNRIQDRAGQSWHVPENIGWRPLSHRLIIDRTSSQDRGVNLESNVVVATAALEVGFNDPQVGAVIQHKSPHQMASFVQRRGRAGRSTKMRPWMVTILSDYGRDRLTFQAYEQLFDPVLRPQHLPVRNQYLLRMQAVFAFFDWLITALPTTRTWWWQPLGGPAEPPSGPSAQATVRQQNQVVQLLKRLIDGDGTLEAKLIAHLVQALGLGKSDVQSLLYEPPRSLLLEVLPTLYRRLVTNWESCPPLDPNRAKYPPDIQQGTRSFRLPLPEFAPPNLFSDLNLPEVTVVVPPARSNGEESPVWMPIVQALRVLVPGQVSRRFGSERGGLSHWIPIPTAPVPAEPHPYHLEKYFSRSEYVAEVPATVGGGVIPVPCYRPWSIRPVTVTDRTIDPTSRGSLNWESQFMVAPDATTISLPSHHEWSTHLPTLRFSLHALRAPTIVRRYAHSATVMFKRKNHAAVPVTSYFVFGASPPASAIGDNQPSGTQIAPECPAAVGFELSVDALSADLRLPDGAGLLARASTATSLPAWRIARWRDLVMRDPILAAVPTTPFEREWLEQVYSAALITTAWRSAQQLGQADHDLHTANPEATFGEVIRSVFRLQDADASATASQRDVYDGPTPTADAIRDLLGRPDVLTRLRMLSEVLWHPLDSGFSDWVQDRLHETVGEALLHACAQLTPQHAAFDTLVLDLADEPRQSLTSPSPSASTTTTALRRVIISETTLGGAGVLQEVTDAVARDPRALAQALAAVTAPSDHETVAEGLERFLSLTQSDAVLAASVAHLRSCQDYSGRDAARVSLHRQLAQYGLLVDHSLSTALNHRLLRAGTSDQTDRLFADLLECWHEAINLIGVSMPLRTFAFLSATSPTFGPRLHALIHAITGTPVDDTDLTAVLSGLLWAQPDEVRRRALETYNPFRARGFTDPSLIRELLLVRTVTTVELHTADWLETLTSALSTERTARLSAPVSGSAELKAALARLIATPVNLDYLQFYPVVEQVERHRQLLIVTMGLRELA